MFRALGPMIHAVNPATARSLVQLLDPTDSSETTTAMAQVRGRGDGRQLGKCGVCYIME